MNKQEGIGEKVWKKKLTSLDHNLKYFVQSLHEFCPLRSHSSWTNLQLKPMTRCFVAHYVLRLERAVPIFCIDSKLLELVQQSVMCFLVSSSPLQHIPLLFVHWKSVVIKMFVISWIRKK